MKAYHRIVGDPPSRGFGASIDSPGFPKDNWAANMTRTRIQTVVPNPKFPAEGLVVEQYRAYELQSLQYGQIAAILSAVGLKKELSARPHGYTHIAAFACDGEGHVATDDGCYAQWLSYDAFMSMMEFWNIPANMSTMEATDFAPPQSASFSWQGILPEGMLEALLVRYWRSATKRAFGAKHNASASDKVVTPVEVCLGEMQECTEIINQAKGFFSDVIARHLPLPVHNILSMSAPISQKSPVTPFQPTALVFLYPEEDLTPKAELFDLRTGSFSPISPQEHRFAEMILRGELPASLTDLYQRYQEKIPHQPLTHCAFMADFDVAWLLFRLDEGQLPPQELFSVWRDLTEHLQHRHSVPDALRDHALEGIEALIAEQLLAKTEAEFSLVWTAEDLRFVFKKAFVAPEGFGMKAAELLARHQRTRKPPFIASLLNEIDFNDTNQVERGCQIYGYVLEQAYINPPLGQQERDLLASAGYVKLCGQYPPLQKSTSKFILEALNQYPERNLFMMPLSLQFLDGYELLRQSLMLLCRAYTKELPSQEVCKDIRLSLKQYLNDENRTLLNQYYVRCFLDHIDSPRMLEPICKAIGNDMTEALVAMLEACQEHEGSGIVRLSAEQLQELFLPLLPMAEDKERVRKAFLSYIPKVLAHSLQAHENQFYWLCTINPQGDLLPAEMKKNLATGYFYEYGLQFEEVPAPEAFTTLYQWVKTSAPEGEYRQRHEAGLKKLYDKLGDKGLSQLSLLLPYFSSTSDTSYINGVFLQECQKDLAAAWTKGEKYWEAVFKRQVGWQKGSFISERLLTSQEFSQELKRIGQGNLEKELSALKTLEDFQKAYDQWAEQGNSSFGTLWSQVMQKVFISRFAELLGTQCNILEDVTRLENMAAQMGATDGLKGSYGQQCLDALRQTVQFIQRVLPTLDDSQTVEMTREKIALLLALKRDGESQSAYQAAYQRIRQLLKETFFVTRKTQVLKFGVNKRTAVGLLCCVTNEDAFMAESFLELFGAWDEASMQKPYDAKNMDSLMALIWLFGSLELYHSNYPKVLYQALSSDAFLPYTRAVRKDRKNAKQYFPWQTPRWKERNQAFEPNLNLMLWLTSK